MVGLSKARRRYLKAIFWIFVVALPIYTIGNFLHEQFIFNVGLALMIFVLTLLGNIMFQTWWVEEQEGK